MVTYHGELSDVNFFICNSKYDDIDAEELMAIGRRFEEATAFAVEWYRQYLDWEFQRITHNIVHMRFDQGASMRPAGNTASYLVMYAGVAVHEVVHLLMCR